MKQLKIWHKKTGLLLLLIGNTLFSSEFIVPDITNLRTDSEEGAKTEPTSPDATVPEDSFDRQPVNPKGGKIPNSLQTGRTVPFTSNKE